MATTTEEPPLDELSQRLRDEALQALQDEPELGMLLKNTVLAPGVRTFEDAIACTITYRMLLRPCHAATTTSASSSINKPPAAAAQSSSSPMMFCPNSLHAILHDALHSTSVLEAGHSMAEAVRRDVLAICDRDPAVDSVLEVVLFLKGFAALVAHRAAYYKWHSSKKKKSMVALWLQSQASAVFAVDIHPAATMGGGILLDHGTGIVIGETATVGDGCTILHGVTLGGTGKEEGDRHPKVGAYCLIGANASLLGNIVIGQGAKIGAGSIVLGPIPSGATAVGAPAKIIGRAKEAKPGSTVDETLMEVSLLHKSASSTTVTTASMTGSIGTRDTSSESDWDVDASEEAVAKDADKNSSLPKTIQASNTSETNCICPFRDYVVMARSAPAGSITICALRRLLGPEGCSTSEIGEVIFQLDTRNVGYCKPNIFFGTEGRDAIVHNTKLTLDRVTVIMAEFETQWRSEQTLLETPKNVPDVAPAPLKV